MSDSSHPSWICPCGRAVNPETTLCPWCSRFRWEARPGSTGESTPAEPNLPSPRRYSRLPLVLLVLVAAGLMIHFGGERNLAWEVMPVLTSRPAGKAVTCKLDLEPGKAMSGKIRARVSRFTIEWSGNEVQKIDQLEMVGRFKLFPDPDIEGDGIPETGSLLCSLKGDDPDLDSIPEEYDAWKTLIKLGLRGALDSLSRPHPLPRAVENGIHMVSRKPFRMGEAGSASFDSSRAGSLIQTRTRLGDWVGWAGYSVLQVTETYLKFKVLGGMRLDLPEKGLPVPLAARILLAPLGKISTVRAKLNGEIRVFRLKQFSACFTFGVQFEILGTKQGRPFSARGDLLLDNPGWTRIRELEEGDE